MQRIIAAIREISSRHPAQEVWSSWLEATAISIENARIRQDAALEARYSDIMMRYTEQDREIFPRLTALLIDVLETNPFQDVLGTLYMELLADKMSKDKGGQVFTPSSLSEACARLSLRDEDLSKYSITAPLRIADPAVGGGVMPIAACKVLSELGFNWQRDALFTCADLDFRCVCMSYIQLSLIGARAVIQHQDSLTGEIFSTWVTPLEKAYGNIRRNRNDRRTI